MGEEGGWGSLKWNTSLKQGELQLEGKCLSLEIGSNEIPPSIHNCTLIQSNNRSAPLMNPSCLLRVIYISEHRGHRANAQRVHFQSVTHVPWTGFSFASWHFSANNPRHTEWFFLLLLVMKSYILSLHQLHLVSTNLHIWMDVAWM